jgi:hypothetical protein
MKNLIFTFLALLLISNTWAQSYVQVGEGDEKVYQPSYSLWKYSYCSMLYHADELGEAKVINKLAFFYNGEDLAQWDADFDVTNQSLWVKHTTDEYFEGNGDNTYNYEFPHIEGMGFTKVFEGSFHFGIPGWVEITLDTPFEYNGKENLILHWENRFGDEKWSVKFQGTIMDGDCMVKCAGADGAVPQTAGYKYDDNARLNLKFYYEGDEDTPETPELNSPAANAIKVDLNDSLTFTIGANTTSYDVYMGATEESMEIVAGDIVVDEPGVYKYHNQEGQWYSNQKFVWKVVAKNESKTTTSGLNYFSTQEIIVQFPWSEGFEDYWIGIAGDKLSSVVNVNYPDSTPWEWNDYWNAKPGLNAFQGNFAAKCGAWHPGDYYLMTPRLDLPENFRISFWWRNNYLYEDKEGKAKRNNSRETKITTVFEASNDGGETWTALVSMTPTEMMTKYENVIVDLTGFAGNNTYLRWVYKETDDYNPSNFWLDEILVSAQPTGGNVAFDYSEYTYEMPICIGGESKFNVVARNTGTKDVIINNAFTDGPFLCDYNDTIAPGALDTITIVFKPKAAGVFENSMMFNINGATGDNQLMLKGTGVEPLNSFFEAIGTKEHFPEGWNPIQSSHSSYIVQNIWITGMVDDQFSPPYAIKMNRINETDTVDPVILVSPGVRGYDVNELTFWAKKGGNHYSLKLEVGVMTDPNDPSTFEVQQVEEIKEYFNKHTVNFKPTLTAPYIGFRFGDYVSNDGLFPHPTLRIDDISWEQDVKEAPKCAKVEYPVNGAVGVNIMEALALKWSAGSANTNGYKISVGTTEAANEIVNEIDIENEYKYTVDYSFEYSTEYFFKLVPYNQYGENTECGVYSFTTMDDPLITSYPYVEDFENTLNKPSSDDYPLGWAIENSDNDYICWDMINVPPAYDILTHNKSKGSIHVPLDVFSAKDDWLFTPPLQMKKGYEYTAEFYVYTIMDPFTGLVYNEELTVWVGNGFTSAQMTDSLAYTNIDDDTDWKLVKVKYKAKEDGVNHFGFHCISAPEQYLLLFDDLTIKEKLGNSVEDEHSGITIYPNPAEEKFFIETSGQGGHTINIIDVSGKVVYSQLCSDQINSIDTRNWEKGFYMVLLTQGDKTATAKLLVK